jgi:hypothetical protein
VLITGYSLSEKFRYERAITPRGTPFQGFPGVSRIEWGCSPAGASH